MVLTPQQRTQKNIKAHHILLPYFYRLGDRTVYRPYDTNLQGLRKILEVIQSRDKHQSCQPYLLEAVHIYNITHAYDNTFYCNTLVKSSNGSVNEAPKLSPLALSVTRLTVR